MLLSTPLIVAAAISTAAAQYVPAIRGNGPLLDPRHAVRTRTGRRSGPGSKIVTWNLKEQAINGTTAKRKFRPKRQLPGSEPPVAEVADYKWVWKDVEDFRGLAYFIEVEIGDPIQVVMLMPDTGSYETWVNPNCAEGRATDPMMCVRNMHYNISKSQLGRYVGGTWHMVYGTGEAIGQYVEDRFYYRHEDLVVRQKFGMATDSVYTVSGIMGLGYGYGYTIDYYNVLDTLVVYNYINGPVFSTALGRIGEGLSEIVFGGVNRSRFSGKLNPIKIWPSVYEQPSGWTHYKVNVTSFGVTLQNGTSTRLFKAANKAQQVNALVDTGATNSYLPWAIVDRFVAYTKAYDVLGELQCDCKWREDAGTIDFGFNDDSVKMRVPISDFIFPLGDGRCVLGMQKREGNENDAILGQTFLRGVYAVWDQMTHTVWMANYKRCGIASQVDEVGLSLGDVADMTGYC